MIDIKVSTHIMTSSAHSKKRNYIFPLILSLVLVGLDQITKFFVLRYMADIRFGGAPIEIIGDFLRLIRTHNTGAAFSLGRGILSPDLLRILLLIVTGILLVSLVIYLIRSRTIHTLQRWALSMVVGGGFGNFIDRLLHNDGVVDFIDVKFYGLLGFERWPTFNLADTFVVVGGVMLIIATFMRHDNNKRLSPAEQKDADDLSSKTTLNGKALNGK